MSHFKHWFFLEFHIWTYCYSNRQFLSATVLEMFQETVLKITMWRRLMTILRQRLKF